MVLRQMAMHYLTYIHCYLNGLFDICVGQYSMQVNLLSIFHQVDFRIIFVVDMKLNPIYLYIHLVSDHKIHFLSISLKQTSSQELYFNQQWISYKFDLYYCCLNFIQAYIQIDNNYNTMTHHTILWIYFWLKIKFQHCCNQKL